MQSSSRWGWQISSHEPHALTTVSKYSCSPHHAATVSSLRRTRTLHRNLITSLHAKVYMHRTHTSNVVQTSWWKKRWAMMSIKLFIVLATCKRLSSLCRPGCALNLTYLTTAAKRGSFLCPVPVSWHGIYRGPSDASLRNRTVDIWSSEVNSSSMNGSQYRRQPNIDL